MMTFRIYTNGQPSEVFTGTTNDAMIRARESGGRLFQKIGKHWHFTGFDGARDSAVWPERTFA